MQIKRVPIDYVKIDSENSRKHPEKNMDAIIGSIETFGQVEPLVVQLSTKIIIGGNGRVEAMKKLGFKEIDIVEVDVNDVQAKAMALALNRSGELAEWNMEQLQETLNLLRMEDFDLDAIGFDESFFKENNEGTEGLTDPDDVPENVETRCKSGDLWQLGNHRLLCGDSTNKGDVERLMGGEKADMVFTDPPYGMKLDTNYQNSSVGIHSGGNRGINHRKVIGDHDDFSPELINTIFASFRYCNEIFIFGADYFAENIPDRNEGSWIVWDKVTNSSGEVSGCSKFHGSNFELCWSKAKHKRDLARVMHKGLASVENDKRVHPTQKPAKLAEWFFERWGKPNDLVADLFLGSGSTLIACEKTGRKCYGMEIDPHYCDVIIKRWEQFTGKEAVLCP